MAREEQYYNLKLSVNSSSDKWNRAVDMLQDRISGRYFEPIEKLINVDSTENAVYTFSAVRPEIPDGFIIEEEEEIVENYCKTRNMFLITVEALEQIIEEATLNGYKIGIAADKE